MTRAYVAMERPLFVAMKRWQAMPMDSRERLVEALRAEGDGHRHRAAHQLATTHEAAASLLELLGDQS